MNGGKRLAAPTTWTSWTRHASRHTHLQEDERRSNLGRLAGAHVEDDDAAHGAALGPAGAISAVGARHVGAFVRTYLSSYLVVITHIDMYTYSIFNI